MRLEAPKRSRAPGLTSLIDVIFLLLMFFMLASTFSIYQRLDVGTGKEGTGQMQEAPVLLRVFSEGEISLNGDRLNADAILQTLTDAKIKQDRPIAIFATKESTVQDVVTVLETLKTAGWSATLIGN